MAALENLDPAVRLESILDGQDIEPATRLEYFLKKAAEGGGGGGNSAFYVHLTISNPDPLTYGADKTFEEILAAYNAGKVIIFVDEIDNHGCAVALYVNDEGGSFGCYGTFIAQDPISVQAWVGRVTFDDEVFYNSTNMLS